MIASKSLLAALALVAALGIASVQADEHAENCIKLLSSGLAGVSISLEVHDFVELVRATLPGVQPEDYGTLKRDERVQKLEAAFPTEDCNDLLDEVDELTMQAIGDNALCKHIFANDEESTLELAKRDSVLALVYEAKEACFAFPPPGGVH